MKINSLKNLSIKMQCLITCSWLVLLTIIVSFAITGCVPSMNSVGKKQFQLSSANRSKSKKQREHKKQVQAINYDEEDNSLSNNEQTNALLEFEKKINSANMKKNPQTIKKESQIMSSEDKYEALRNEFDESIFNVKEELLEIKRILSDVAAEKMKPTAERTNYFISNINKSNSVESSTINESDDNVLNKTFIIQSEEQMLKSKNVNEQQSKQAPIQPKKEVKTNKKFKIVKTTATKRVANIQKDSQTEANNMQKVENAASISNSEDNNFTDVISKLAKGDYNSALKIVNDKLRQSKDPVVVSNCNYWLGEISFNQRDYAKSIAYFNTALNNNCDKKDIAQARIAESYLRVGKNDEAKIAYQNLLKEYPKSTYSPKAKKMLQQL